MMKKRHKKIEISDEQRKKCNTIIHTHSAMCGGIGTGMAQIPLADNAVITPIQIAMIIELGVVFKQKISTTIAQSILSGASASLIGRGVSQVLFGWIPGLGNVINTATAAGLTEAIGWMAVDRFSKEKFIEEKSASTSEEKSTEENSVNDDESEEDYSEIKKEAQFFFDGEKNYTNNRKEYDELIEKLEQELKTLSDEHELRKIYNDLCDLPWK